MLKLINNMTLLFKYLQQMVRTNETTGQV